MLNRTIDCSQLSTSANQTGKDGISKADKAEANEAIKAGNVFCILGSGELVREILRKRGWIEVFFSPNQKFYKQQPLRIPYRLKLLEENDEIKDHKLDADKPTRYADTLYNKIAMSAIRFKLPPAPDYIRLSPFSYLSVTGNKAELPWEEADARYAILARMARHTTPRLFWVTRFFQIDLQSPLLSDCYVNIFPDSTMICNKGGLCRVLKRLPLILNQNPDTIFPRSYNLGCEDERKEFIDDFRKTACVSVLRYVVESKFNGGKRLVDIYDAAVDANFETNPFSHVNDRENKSPNQFLSVQEVGDVSSQSSPMRMKPKIVPKIQYKEDKSNRTPLPVCFIRAAIELCRRMLEGPIHSEIDGELDPEELSNGEWDTFLQHFYRLSKYTIDYDEIGELFHECEQLLEKLKTQRQQFRIDGCRNIWIMKPKGSSRGRGILCSNDVEKILQHIVRSDISDVFGNKLVVQKYVERPLLICNTKFDIRQYFLVTDWNRLTVWWYNDFYLRFCSQQFTLQDFDKSVHISNHPIQIRYQNGARSPLLPEDNMWDSKTFHNWLISRGEFYRWNSDTVPAMKNTILSVLRCGQEGFSHPRRKSFQLYGADFIIDESFKPWLLEINAMPALQRTTAVTATIVFNVIEDTFKTVLDKGPKKDTGQFVLLFRQHHFTPATNHVMDRLQIVGRSIKIPVLWKRLEQVDAPVASAKANGCAYPVNIPEVGHKTLARKLNPVLKTAKDFLPKSYPIQPRIDDIKVLEKKTQIYENNETVKAFKKSIDKKRQITQRMYLFEHNIDIENNNNQNL